jgi:hypothetical protein
MLAEIMRPQLVRRATKNESRGRTMLNRCLGSALVVALVTLGLASTSPSAEEFPTRPVTIIVPQPPGGGTDIIARIIGDQL